MGTISRELPKTSALRLNCIGLPELWSSIAQCGSLTRLDLYRHSSRGGQFALDAALLPAKLRSLEIQCIDIYSERYQQIQYTSLIKLVVACSISSHADIKRLLQQLPKLQVIPKDVIVTQRICCGEALLK